MGAYEEASTCNTALTAAGATAKVPKREMTDFLPTCITKLARRTYAGGIVGVQSLWKNRTVNETPREA